MRAGFSARLVAVIFDWKGFHYLPTMEVIQEAQAVMLDQPAVETPVGSARLEQDGLYCV